MQQTPASHIHVLDKSADGFLIETHLSPGGFVLSSSSAVFHPTELSHAIKRVREASMVYT